MLKIQIASVQSDYCQGAEEREINVDNNFHSEYINRKRSLACITQPSSLPDLTLSTRCHYTI